VAMVSKVKKITEKHSWSIGTKDISVLLAQDNEVESEDFLLCSKKWRVRLESESGELEIFLDSTEEDDNFSAEYTLRIRRKYRDGTTRSEHWMCDLSHGGWSAGWGMPSLETLPFHPNLEGYTFDFTVTVYDCNLQHEEVFSYNREVIEIPKMMSDLYKTGLMSDFEIEAKDGTLFKVHRVILAYHSPFFEAMFKHNTLETLSNSIQIDDFPPQILKIFIRYMYKGIVEERTDFQKLFLLADKYKVKELCRHCVIQMIQKMEVSNCCEYLFLLKQFGLLQESKLRKSVVKFITKNLHLVQETPEFDRLMDQKDLLKLIFAGVTEKRGKKRKLSSTK